MTSSNENIFRVTGPLCGEFTGPGEFPTQRPVTRSFDAIFDMCLNKRLSKQPWGWWFGMPSWSLWRHGNEARKSSLISPHKMVQFYQWKLVNFINFHIEVSSLGVLNKWAFVKIMGWWKTGSKPISRPMMTQFSDTYMQHGGRWVNK